MTWQLSGATPKPACKLKIANRDGSSRLDLQFSTCDLQFPYSLELPLAGSLPSVQEPASFWYSHGVRVLPASAPCQPMTWFGFARFLLRSSQRVAQLASASTGFR